MLETFLRQILSLAAPVGFLWLCLLALTAALWWKRQRGLSYATGVLAVFVTVIGGTPLGGKLLGSLERPYAGVAFESLPEADAIVLLGGGARPSRYEAGGLHLTPAGDRLVMAHALFQRGKAPALLIGGIALELDGSTRLESELTRDLLATWGVPREAMIALGANGDTHDEALKVRALAAERGWRRVLLVTSAYHLRRATATFRAQGLETIPAPCSFLTSIATEPPVIFNIPNADGFTKIALWMREHVGWFVYRRRGWIEG